MIDNQSQKFNKFQEFVFPIHKHELKKFLPMSFLMFGIVFVYHLVSILKNFFVNYNSTLWLGARPEETTSLFSALKFWYVLPSAFLAVMAFTVLLNKVGSTKAFYIMISLFMVFFFVYGFILYPNLSHIIPSSESITLITSKFPVFFRASITCLLNWPLAIFYVISELWGVTTIAFLFWQFANKITMNNEVKRFFGLFSLLANIGTILAGSAFINFAHNLSVSNVKILIMIIIAVGVVILGIYFYINRVVLKDPLLYDESKILPKKHGKNKIGVAESIKILFKNSYLLLVTLIVLSYGICANFSEIIMFSFMKEAFTKAEYANMHGTLTIFTGIFASLIILFSNNILRKFSWKVAAVTTPICCLTAGGAFMLLVLYKQFISASIFGMSSTVVAVWCGIFYDALAKGFKYSLFDATKGMTYRPLDEEERNKGQAAVEIIGGRAGKASASAVQQILLSFPTTLQTTTGSVSGILAHSPVLVVSFFATVVLWIFSVFKLSDKYEKKIKEKNLK